MRSKQKHSNIFITRRRAFTLTEMLVCVLCIGILTAAIAAFYVTANSQALAINSQKAEILSEYSDITTLQNKPSIAYLELSNLDYPEYLIEAGRVAIGTPQIPEHGMALESNQAVKYESADTSIAAYDEGLGVVGVAPGVTYLKATLCVVESNGSLTETDMYRILPVYVHASDDSYADGVRYFYYNGRYLQAWIVEEKGPTQI